MIIHSTFANIKKRTIMNRLKLTIAFLTIILSVTACTGNKAQEAQKQKENKEMTVIHLTKADFLKKVSNYEANPNEWKYEGDVPCVVDFFATWCGPCKMLSPIMDSVAEEYKGKIIVYKVDVDKEEDLAAAFGVQSIPTLLWIPIKGDPFFSRGAMNYADLKKVIDEKLLSGK
jgi:thioredoxin 1